MAVRENPYDTLPRLRTRFCATPWCNHLLSLGEGCLSYEPAISRYKRCPAYPRRAHLRQVSLIGVPVRIEKWEAGGPRSRKA